MKWPILTILFLLAVLPARAATHYVSYSAGADTNNGTSESTPWKHLPGMQTCANNCSSYTPAAGDTFILRGCDDWPNASFPIVWIWSGSSGSLITVTVDKTWYNTSTCPVFWNRPIFDAGGAVITALGSECGGNVNNSYLLDEASYNWFAWIEATGFAWAGSCQNSDVVYFHNVSTGVSNDTVDNWYVHNAGPTSGNTNDNPQFFESPIEDCGELSTVSCTVQYTIINNCDGASKQSGGTQYGGFIGGVNIEGDIFVCLSNAIKTWGNGIIAYNNIQRIAEVNTGGHPNCFETLGTYGTGIFYIHDNYIQETTGGGCEGGQVGNTGEYDFMWNNVYYMVGDGANGPQVPSNTPNTNTWSMYMWNNTMYWASGCVNTGTHGTNIVNWYFQNNHCINDNSYTVNGNTAAGNAPLVPTGSSIVGNSLAMPTATAASQGYTATENLPFSPTATGNSTVGAGTSLASEIETTWPSQVPNMNVAYVEATGLYGSLGACQEEIVKTVLESVCPPGSTVAQSNPPDEGAYTINYLTTPQITVNVANTVGAISQDIYCTSDSPGFPPPDPALVAIVKWPCARMGGDAASNYNGAYNSFNSGADNYFLQGYPSESTTAYALADDWFTTNRTALPTTQMLMTIPVNTKVAIDDFPRCSWDVGVFGFTASQIVYSFNGALYPSVGTGLTVDVTSVSGGGITGVSVTNGGSGFQVNDEVYVSPNVVSTNHNLPLLKVTSVGAGGTVTGLSIVNAGTDTSTGAGQVTGGGCAQGGNGDTNTILSFLYSANSTTVAANAISHFVGKWGPCSSNGFCFYQLDNEPAAWAATHADWQASTASYSTIASDGEEYATQIKTSDTSSGIRVLGPSDYGPGGWSLGGNPSYVPTSDPALVYYLKSFNTYDTGNSKRTLDCADEHFAVFNGGNFSSIAAALQGSDVLWNGAYSTSFDSGTWGYFSGAIDGTSLGSGGSGYAVNDTFTINGGTTDYLASGIVTAESGGVVTAYTITGQGGGYTSGANGVATTHTSGSGSGLTIDIGSVSPYLTASQLLPRFNYYVNKFYPGTSVCDSEIDWTYYQNIGAGFPNIVGDGYYSGGSSVIDMLSLTDMYGLFGQYGVFLASRFDVINAGEAQAFTYEMFLNYDGAGHTFGNTALQSYSSYPDTISVYGATRSSDGHLTIIAINKTASSITTPINYEGYSASSSVGTYTYDSGNTGAIVESSTSTSTLASGYTLPAYSATLLDLSPASAPSVTPAAQITPGVIITTGGSLH